MKKHVILLVLDVLSAASEEPLCECVNMFVSTPNEHQILRQHTKLDEDVQVPRDTMKAIDGGWSIALQVLVQ